MKTKLFLILSVLFSLLTFVGAAYVLINKGSVNAGYACVPMVFAFIFTGAYRNSKRK